MDWVSSIVGGAIGFISSIGALTAEKMWDYSGKLRVFYLIRSSGDKPVDTFGASSSSDGMAFVLPLAFELQNTSNMARVMRDVSVNLYHKGVYIDEMTQICRAGSKKEYTEYGGENQSYSFVVQPRSIHKVFGTYVYAPDWTAKEKYDFDEIRLKYYDEKNHAREYHLRYIEDPWNQCNIDGDENWILLENNSWFKPQKTDFEQISDPIPFDSNKVSYLQMLQEPISRMSTASAIFKGFAATIVAGIAALTYCQINTWILGLSFVPVLLFAILDIYYLKLEKKYRFLYDQVRIGKHPVDFSMKLPRTNKEAKSRIWDCIKSPSIWVFYPAMIAILIVVFLLKLKGVI